MITRIHIILTCFFFFVLTSLFCQPVANYVLNGSFEERIGCTGQFKLDKAVGWSSIDSISFGARYISTCAGHIPLNGNTYQFPKTGNAYIISTWYDETWTIVGFPRNRLKRNLQSGKTYCVKFYINLTNNSPRGMDGFAGYFGDSSLDTITKCNIPLTYLVPQVSNPAGNIISDTMNWVPITGTFVANGNEKYLLLGNFLSNNSVQTSSINTPYYPEKWTDVCVDDVSCIEVGINAYAGKDTAIVPGDSAFIGREPDFAIDPFCTWYQWPSLTTPINIVSGMWVKPVNTTTYIVKQELDCGALKWDTVVVYMNLVGLSRELLEENVELYPLPVGDELTLRIKNEIIQKEFKSVSIYNQLGEMIRKEELIFEGDVVSINTQNFATGVYNLELTSGSSATLRKKFLIAR